MTKKSQADELLKKHVEQTLDDQEEALLESWYVHTAKKQADLSPADLDSRLNSVWRRLPINQERRLQKRKSILKWAAAACITLSLGAGLYKLIPIKPQIAQGKPESLASNEVLPGGAKAVLTLGNGHKIILEKAKQGKLAELNGMRISKLANETLVYQGMEDDQQGVLDYNMLTVPRSGQYQLILPDGSKVWLNSQSSLRYPSKFSMGRRTVELTGEAYFEIAHDVKRPFIVKSKDQNITVLGTRFNVNAYSDEPATVTTLIDGSVELGIASKTVLLKPGHKALQRNGNIIIQPASIQQAVAWKTGAFDFSHLDIKAIMRQIQRWYDIEVIFHGIPSTELYGGSIPRNVKLTQVIQILESSGLSFRVSGKTVTVYSN